MTTEHTPRPGAHWNTQITYVEVIDDQADDADSWGEFTSRLIREQITTETPGQNEPAPLRLNRRQRRDLARALRRKGRTR
ncbi:hypothetical protein PV350_04910 [Streptomyces sp. PA03-6a]|nr:hypothetical protein [Streptomyces sp. PA03-6a]